MLFSKNSVSLHICANKKKKWDVFKITQTEGSNEQIYKTKYIMGGIQLITEGDKRARNPYKHLHNAFWVLSAMRQFAPGVLRTELRVYVPVICVCKCTWLHCSPPVVHIWEWEKTFFMCSWGESKISQLLCNVLRGKVRISALVCTEIKR